MPPDTGCNPAKDIDDMAMAVHGETIHPCTAIIDNTGSRSSYCSDIQGTDYLIYAFASVCFEPFVHAFHYLDSHRRVNEIGRPDLYGRSPGHQKFDGITGIHDASKTYHRDIDGTGYLPDHAEGDRLDSRARQTAGRYAPSPRP